MENTVHRILSIISMLLITQPAFALTEEEELGLFYGDEAFISIATGLSKPISKAPAVATIITSKQIEEVGARTIDDVLETVPGLHVSDSSTRLSPIYSIRGIHTDKNPQVLMLLNGIPMTQLYFGDRGPLSSLPVGAISRIEIIRGPGSAVYGADAFAGVINVITKTADEYDGYSISARVSEFNTKDASFAYGGETESGFKTSFNLQVTTTDGDDSRLIGADAQTIFDGATGTTVSNAPGPMSTGLERLDFNAEVSKGDWIFRFWSRYVTDSGAGPGIALALDPTGSAETKDYLLDFTQKNVAQLPGWTFDIRFSHYDVNSKSESTLFPAGTFLPIDSLGNVNPITGAPVFFPQGLIGNPEVYEQRTNLELTGISRDFGIHDVRLSAGATRATLDPKESKNYGPGVPVGVLTDVTGSDFIYISTETRNLMYLSVQDVIDIAADWELTAGVRYDDYSDFGSTTNPRLALVWETFNNLTTKLLYGKAFRAPSFAELYAINNPVILGNRQLRPEIIDTFEVAVDYSPGLTHHAGVSLYSYDIKDLIQFVPDGSGAQIARNTGKQSGEGIELEWVWKPDEELIFTGNFALASARDKTNDAEVANFPGKQVYLKINWSPLPGWELVPEVFHIADRHRAAGDPRPNPSDYSLVNLSVNSINNQGGYSWGAGVKNLTDRNTVEPSPFEVSLPTGSFVPGDFPRSGRMFYVTGKVEF
jgi:outer membrane receptor for ferrienterochelin and colicins